ncbi:hypothetical protein P0Y35_06820 [Kiritimatiellaeota bacterium B1221]|nr:hypothetical protein [Kiritimatiellaeota bacterium B1221]
MGKPKYPSWILPILAVSLSLTVHALWLLPPQALPPAQPAPQESRLYAYLNLDARTWSPTLFSLPSSLGFSGAIEQNASNVEPPLKSPVQLTRLEPVNLSLLFDDAVLHPPLAMQSQLPVTVYSDHRPASKPAFPSVWRLQVLEGPSSKLELSRLPPEPSGGSVVVTGDMTFDQGGQLTSLILDPMDLPENLRSDIVRVLRRVRREGSQIEARIRFRFSFAPSEGEE